MSLESDIIALVISIIAIIFSVITWYRKRPIEKQQYDSQSMLACFNILSDEKIKSAKSRIVEEYCKQKKTNPATHVIFDKEKFGKDLALTLEAYNQASVLYQLKLLNKQGFQFVYGGSMVRFYKIVKTWIDKKKEANPPYCKHFEEVVNELIKEGITDEPYCYDI